MKTINTFRFALVVLAFQLAVLPAFAQTDAVVAYVTITGSRSGIIKGDATAKGSEGKIECTGYSFAIKNTLAVGGSAAGAGVGKVAPTTIVITKHIDKATPVLMRAATNGEILTSVVIDVYKQSNDGMILVQSIPFKTAVINSIAQSAGANAASKSTQPVEVLTITATTVQLTSGTATGGLNNAGGTIIKQPVKALKAN
ncbi:MAG TPA: type VI secretion system tube protein Hcp [Mucilaginibacter sp.]|nr:type VI secretion system tube protein Hcp [Mucilaginibacter sp.]